MCLAIASTRPSMDKLELNKDEKSILTKEGQIKPPIEDEDNEWEEELESWGVIKVMKCCKW